jgi:hypothetical protein
MQRRCTPRRQSPHRDHVFVARSPPNHVRLLDCHPEERVPLKAGR